MSQNVKDGERLSKAIQQMVRVGTKSTAEEATLNLLIMYLPLTWSCSNENKTHCSNYAAYKNPSKNT